MTQFINEVALFVEDYVKSHGRYECFDACAEDIEAAKRALYAEAEAAGVTVTSITSVTFIEFDSNNPTTAAAYFDIDYQADKSIYWREAE